MVQLHLPRAKWRLWGGSGGVDTSTGACAGQAGISQRPALGCPLIVRRWGEYAIREPGEIHDDAAFRHPSLGGVSLANSSFGATTIPSILLTGHPTFTHAEGAIGEILMALYGPDHLDSAGVTESQHPPSSSTGHNSRMQRVRCPRSPATLDPTLPVRRISPPYSYL